jgi:hypothetical protein
LYLEQEFGLERDRAIAQIAFGGNDYGIDGFHYNGEKRNLYLFQFKYTQDYNQFKQSFNRLIQAGMERIFCAQNQDQQQNQLLLQIKSCLSENEAVIDRVCIYFVFIGDPAEAERSLVLDNLREDLENKRYLIDQRCGRPVTMVIEFRSARTRKVGATTYINRTHTYPVKLDDVVTRIGPNSETMTIGFIRLVDLHAMYQEMGQRFFERNIRAALSEYGAVNRSIKQSLKRIVIDSKEDAKVFAFNHNGVTLFAEALTTTDGQFKITEPRLLNGAQTVTTFAKFLENNKDNSLLSDRRDVLDSIYVLCRIITSANPEFVTMVTINNNRQNPVAPWNLHANDMIQLEIQDKLRDDCGIYYERQEGAFKSLSDEDLEEQGITQYKSIELTRLARTFLASDGNIDKLSSFRDVFEDDRIYAQVFNQSRLKADSRHIVLCYKIQFKLKRIADDIRDKGANKYAYVLGARNMLWALLCQAIMNDPNLEEKAENFGQRLSLEAQYTDWLSSLATMRCRFIFSDLVADKTYASKAADGNFSFMRSHAAYKLAMEIAYMRWHWVEKRLNR